VQPLPAIESLRAKIRLIEAGEKRASGVLPFGLLEIDSRLPGGGLAVGALHEVAGGGNGAVHAAAASLFAAGIAARSGGPVLWCVTRQDLFASALVQAGLPPERIVYVEAANEEGGLACFEEGLRHNGLSAVVAEVTRLSLTHSRRLQLAAESAGTIGIAIRRWRRQADAVDFGQATASATRWRITALPQPPSPIPGLDRARWQVELIRCRGGGSADFELEGSDEQGYLHVPADVADRQVGTNARRPRAIA
jgi:protein ImuA